jgi:hypothetical protein
VQRLARRFSTGWFDYFFGKRSVATTIGKDGRQLPVLVTERWLKWQKDGGHVDPIDLHLVPVHLLGLSGYELTSWVVGEDVDKDAWRRFRDPLTGHLMAMTLLREGEPQTFLVEKGEWLRLKQELDAVDG